MSRFRKLINLKLRKSDKLKPCPFCGGHDALKLVNTHTPVYWIECDACSARVEGSWFAPGVTRKTDWMAHSQARDSAIEKWNTRAEDRWVESMVKQWNKAFPFWWNEKRSSK